MTTFFIVAQNQLCNVQDALLKCTTCTKVSTHLGHKVFNIPPKWLQYKLVLPSTESLSMDYCTNLRQGLSVRLILLQVGIYEKINLSLNLTTSPVITN
jgi:hypothetical protein